MNSSTLGFSCNRSLWSLSIQAAVIIAVSGCSATRNPQPISEHHLQAPSSAVGAPPELVPNVPLPPKPSSVVSPQAERYSVVVNKTPVQDLLFVIARDAKLNIDIHPGIKGSITMSALDQTLTEILDRVSRQVDMRYELEGTNLTVLPDSPFLRHYKVEYPNLKRVSEMSVGSTTSVSGGGSSSSGGSNGSSASITNSSSNQFWGTLVGNIKDLLRETDKVLPAGAGGGAATAGTGSASSDAAADVASPSSGGATADPGANAGPSANAGPAAASGSEQGLVDAAASVLGDAASALLGGADKAGKSGVTAGKGATKAGGGSVAAKSQPQQGTIFRESASVIANAEGGIISVRATMKQHQKVREFIDRAMSSVRRQVLIEGTIVEVDLSDEFQQGINWSLLSQSGNLLIQSGPAGGAMPSGLPVTGVFPSMGLVSGAKKGLFGGPNDFQAAIRLLESFGRARVLSSPKISALNNQPAMLRVVDNLVYFTVSGTYTPATATTPPSVSVSSTANTASVGFTLGVTPQIGADNEVTLLLRPTISRVLSYVDDPAIGIFMSLARAGGSNIPEVTSRVPQIQTREMESVIKVRGGMTAVLGGLMRDSGSNSTDEIPGIGNLGVAGDLLRYKSRKSSKSELVIFLRPVIISDASLEGDYAPWRATLSRVTGPDPYTATNGDTP